ncbi:hypothetical protein BaRGS_00021118 [Batillaria attramentaria]|uniref:Uncharacterized protein n=1 Tax=Batillaria attramentaria TaxID=370345 RepID=A0ABD0KK34_9CAEN
MKPPHPLATLITITAGVIRATGGGQATEAIFGDVLKKMDLANEAYWLNRHGFSPSLVPRQSPNSFIYPRHAVNIAFLSCAAASFVPQEYFPLSRQRAPSLAKRVLGEGSHLGRSPAAN